MPLKLSRRARAALDQAAQSVGVNAAEVERAQAEFVRSDTELMNVQLQTARVLELEQKGLVATAQADAARADLGTAQAARDAAQAALDAAKARLGTSGSDNAALQLALADLAQAELDMAHTTLRAPARGAVSNLTIATGAYAQAGQPLMSFVDAENVWIEAYFTENNLGRMAVGDPVDVVLDIHQGRVINGVVDSFSGAVSLGQAGGAGALSSPPSTAAWMREAQRFPVRIDLPGYTSGRTDDDVLFQVNGQADVMVYTQDTGFMALLGAGIMHLRSYLSYAY